MKNILQLSAILIICLVFFSSAQPETNAELVTASVQTSQLSPVLKHLKSLFQLATHYERFSGVVLVCNRQETLFQQAFGAPDRGITSGLTTRFDIGSISKSFTAAAILTLVHQGKISLQDHINPHLGRAQSDRWKKVTIHHLLTHTSGIPSIYQTGQGLPLFFPQANPIPLNSLIDRFRTGKLRFNPGEEFSYSNSGYVLLAAIIEQVSGQPFEEFMQEAIFEKFNLQHTSFETNEQSAQPYYGYRQDLSRRAPTYHWSWSVGAGGIQSTANDLSLWLHTIQSNSFLNQSLREAYLQQHVTAGYGYGWQFTQEGKTQHDGGTAGFMSFVSFDQETGQEVIVLTNRSFEDIHRYGASTAHVQELVQKTWEALEGKVPETLPEPGLWRGPSATYKFENGTEVSLEKVSDSTVRVTANDKTPSRILTSLSLSGSSSQEIMMNDVAKLLLRKKHWGLAKHCNGEMKFVCYSGLFGIGMKMIRKKTGSLQSVTAFYVNDEHGLLRVIGEKQAADLIVFFDNEGKIQGLFEHGYYPLDMASPLMAFATKEGQLLLDGFNQGEPDARISFVQHSLFLTQSDRTITGVKVSE